MRTKAAPERFIRRRLNTLKKLVEEYELTVDVVLIPSNKNMADQLKRVPQRFVHRYEDGEQTQAIDQRYSHG